MFPSQSFLEIPSQERPFDCRPLALAAAQIFVLILIWIPLPRGKAPQIAAPAVSPVTRNALKTKIDAAEPIPQLLSIGKRRPMPVEQAPEAVLPVSLHSEGPKLAELPEWEIDTPVLPTSPLLTNHPGLIPPTILLRVEPSYPRQALARRIVGTVWVTVVMGANGQLGTPRFRGTLASGQWGFEEEVRRALAQWKFRPGTLNGRAVDVLMTLQIEFLLPDRR
jgi:protein TonB